MTFSFKKAWKTFSADKPPESFEAENPLEKGFLCYQFLTKKNDFREIVARAKAGYKAGLDYPSNE